LEKQEAEIEPSKPLTESRAGTRALDLGLGGLDQSTVGDPRRAGGLAGAAVEAELEVIHHRIGQRDPPLGKRFDEKDPAARRIHLRPKLGVGRAIGEAEAAMDTLR